MDAKTRRGWCMFLTACLYFAYVISQFTMFNSFSTTLLHKYHFSYQQLSLISSSYLLAAIIFMLPAGLLLDRYPIKRLLLITASLTVLGIIWFAHADNVASFALSRFIYGIGNGFAMLGAMRLADQWLPKNKIAIANGMVFTSAMIGAIISHTPVILALKTIGWYATFYLNAFIGIVIAVLIFFVVHDNKDYRNHVIPLKQVFPNLLQSKINYLCGMYCILLNIPLMIIAAFSGNLYLQHVYQYEETTAAIITSCVFYGMLVGSPCTGWLSDYLGHRKAVMTAFGAGAFVTLLLIILLPLSSLFLAIAFFILGFFGSAQMLAYVFAVENNAVAIQSTVNSTIAWLTNVGATAMQLFLGFLLTTETFMPFIDHSQLAFLFLAVMLAFSTIVVYLMDTTPRQSDEII